MKISKGLAKKTEQAKKRIEKERQQREEELAKYQPACLDASDKNLKNGYYCWFCEMSWYNCLCCHEED